MLVIEPVPNMFGALSVWGCSDSGALKARGPWIGIIVTILTTPLFIYSW